MRTSPGVRPRANAVPDSVLHQRLQNKVGHQRCKRMRIDIEIDLQPVAETCLLNVDVLLQKQQLAAQRNFMHADRVERRAQQVGQLQRHMFGRRAIVPRQRRDGIQRVEQEMRFQLNLKHFELRVGQLSFELRRLQSRSRYLP